MSVKAEIRPDEAETQAAAARIGGLPVDLDWQGFLSRCFPGGRRHDFEAIAAYIAYKQLPQEASERHEVAADAVETWEDEGGSGAPSAGRPVTPAEARKAGVTPGSTGDGRREDRARHAASTPEVPIRGTHMKGGS